MPSFAYYVGMPLDTREQIEHLPIGARFGPPEHPCEVYAMTTGGILEVEALDHIVSIISFSLDGFNVVISLPNVEPVEVPPLPPGEHTFTHNGVTYTVTPIRPFNWRGGGCGTQYRTSRVSPDPHCPSSIGPEFYRNMITAYRCCYCDQEFELDLEAYIRSGCRHSVTDELQMQAMHCHNYCAICNTYMCSAEHVYCDECNQYDCGVDGEHEYCDHCDRYDCGRNHSIRNYSYKPMPKWLGGSDAPYYLGFELEVTSYNENTDADRIIDWADDNIGRGSIYCKEDGSVEGFEIVSHPMTPEFFESVDWRGFMATVRQNDSGDRSYEPTNHGLHVHVSRTAFPNTLTLARWIYLWNARQNRRTAIDLCRRESNNWAAFRDSDVRQLSRVAKADRDWMNNAYYPNFPRYSLINLTNVSTVEFRGFRSTRRADAFKKSIRSIYRSVDYVRSMQPCHATDIATDYSLSVATATN